MTTESPQAITTNAQSPALRAGDSIDPQAFAEIRHQLILGHCKWDPQVGDVATLADFPLIIPSSQWNHLTAAAEELTRETLALERALITRPDLHPQLDLPRGISRMFATCHHLTPSACRVMRFDFHPTRDGWRISEVNSDVPGGFTEASALPLLMQKHFPNLRTPDDPVEAYVDALARSAAASNSEHIALLSAPGFMEDHQVIAALANRLRHRSLHPHLAQPGHLRWINGHAHLETIWFRGPLGCIVRFLQAEWLAALPNKFEWEPLFTDGITPVANPGSAILTESKRLPLVWKDLGIPLRAWPAYLPETRKPSAAPWRTDDSWLLKTAFCNTGDSVTARSILPATEWKKRSWDVLLHPTQWIAQRRFNSFSIPTARGLMFPCIGIFTIDGRACGAYGRLSPKPHIDYAAIDAAILIENDSPGFGLNVARDSQLGLPLQWQAPRAIQSESHEVNP
jgi:hypothetical protein